MVASFIGDQCTFPREKPKLHKEVGPFLEEQCTFYGERPQFRDEQSCFELFPITTILCLLLYGHVTYRWKGLKRITTL
jgi:hypothetical protein